jgi:ATP-binding cassette subfamily F protein 3
MKLAFPLSVQPGKLVMELLHVGKSFGEKLIFKDISISIGRGEKIALLGPNGVGKSTLLKRITKSLEGDGEVNYGHNVNVTYFAQDQAEKLDVNKTVFQTVDDLATGDNRKDLRSILGAFLFSGEEVDKKVSVLSGGERTRLALCQLLLSPSNFLILDEPTNHLDMQSKEVLKQALLNYEGTFIVVSHDREFLDGLTNRIWDIEKGSLKIHHFGVMEYLDYKLKDAVQAPTEKKNVIQNSSDKKLEKSIPGKELKRKINQLENRISKLESQINEFETAQKQVEQCLAEIDYSNDVNSKNLLNDFEELKHKIERTMQEWETATTELEDLLN